MSKAFVRLDYNCLLSKLHRGPTTCRKQCNAHTRPMSRHGVFTDWFIFRSILEHFSRENGISAPSMSAFEALDIKKEN